MNKAHMEKTIEKFIKDNEDLRGRKDGKSVEHYVVKNRMIHNVKNTQVDMESFVEAVLDNFSHERFEVYRAVLAYDDPALSMIVNKITIDEKGYDNRKATANMTLSHYFNHGGYSTYLKELISGLDMEKR